MTRNLKLILLACLVYLTPFIVNAQAPDPGGDPDVPIDGGISLLLAAGVGFVAKKGYDQRKKTASFGNDA